MRYVRNAFLFLWLIAILLLLLRTFVDWNELEHNQLQDKIDAMLDIQHEVLDVLVTGYQEKAEIDITSSIYLYRVFENGELIKWSDNKTLPPYSLLRRPDSVYYIDHATGKFIVQRTSFQQDGAIVEFFSILPLQQKFRIQNKYLTDIINTNVFEREPSWIDTSGDHLIRYKGTNLFAFGPSRETPERISGLAIWLLIASLPLVILLLLRQAKDQLSRNWYLIASLLGLIFLRVLLIAIEFPGSYLEISIFDPVVYNSSILGFTLGDLLINYCFFLVIAGIVSNHFSEKFVLSSWALRAIVLFVVIGFTYLNIQAFHWLLTDLTTHSQIVFDITKSIEFDLNRVVAVALVLSASVVYFLVNHIIVRVISALEMPGGLYLFFHLVAVAAFIHFIPTLFPIFLLQFAWYWIMYLSDLSLKFHAANKVALEYVLSVGAMLALVFAFANDQAHQNKELEEKSKFANRLVLEKDVLGEYYLNEILDVIRSDETIPERLDGGIFARQNIREKISRQFVSSYFDKYELEVFLFSEQGEQFDLEEGETYSQLKEKYALAEFRTDYEGIFHVNISENISSRLYVCFIEYQEGFIAMNLNRKRNTLANVFPELLVESKYEQENIGNFDYTIFRDSTVLYGQGTFGHVNYLEPDDLSNPKLYEVGIVEDSRHFLGHRTLDGRTIVVVSPAYENKNWVVNFSFLFLLIILLTSIVGVIYRLGLHFRSLTLANKIQLYLATGFLIPLFITGFALLNTLNNSYREEITRSYLKESLRISESLVDETIKYISDESDLNSFANYVGDVSGFVQADLNIYDIEGRLITTSQPGIFGLDLLSDRISPKALNALSDDDQNIILDESIGLLDFKTTYTAITGYTDGRMYGVVGMPFFDTKNHLKRQQMEVLANLLMIFALIFLFALISGNYILNYLIGPLKLVSDHLKRTTWEEDNQPIDYYRDDEIGALVKEYNQMLVKLERNKEALVRSQKESAWKEIARQVAHEIKNPLTPMRLKIQQLQRDIEDHQKVVTLESLVKQIDTMSHIADSFSEFAKMPAPENEDFDLVSVVHESVLLHIGKGLTIETDLPEKAIMVWADPKIIDRIMNNLILNAKQAVEGKEPHLVVKIWKEENKVVISCSDNGSGIKEEIQDKIFTTYFSTKSTGSGIGLAVAKKGIENAGGNIWFETKEGEGTTFFISLPVFETL